jgi:cytochrome b subunit of formate dehydrogenase
MKTLIVLMLVAVLVALASAGVFMLRKPGASGGRGKHMARALALRVGLSVALFLFILLSWYMGWVRPSGLPVGS